ncbi:MAG: hypothetical protein ACJAZ3_001772, partial [Sphingobacteriales bacterium]
FIANCGMARVFAYLMQKNVELSDEAIFTDTSNIIRAALQRVRDVDSDKRFIAKKAFEISLKQLV